MHPVGIATGCNPKIDPNLVDLVSSGGTGLTVLREREHELAVLATAADAAVEGCGRAVAIEASAGLGKTRLLGEAQGLGDDREVEVLTARATELEREFPFALVRQLFGARLSSLPADEREALLDGAGAARAALGLSPEDEPVHDTFAVLHGLYWVTAALAERKPLLLAVDDVHWADAGSLDYLTFLLPRLEELPASVVIAARPDEPAAAEGLVRILGDPALQHLALTPLSAEGATALLEQELGDRPDPEFAAACFEVSGGNPFLVCELARTLMERRIEPTLARVEEVRGLAPERVGRMALPRIGRLSASAGKVASALAVFGDDTDLRLLAELTGLDLGEVRRAADELRAASIFDGSVSPRFIHPLMRNAVYADIPVGERLQAHSAAAALLRDASGDPEAIATQLLAGEADGERFTAEILLEAGQRAIASGAPNSAIAYLRRALREPPPADMRTAVLDSLLEAAMRVADDSALVELEPDLIAEMDRNPSTCSHWALKLAPWMVVAGGRFEDATALLRKAIEAAAAARDVELTIRLEVQLSALSMLLGSVPQIGPDTHLARYASRLEPSSVGARLAAAMEIFPMLETGTAEQAADAAKRALADDGAILVEESEVVASSLAVMALVSSSHLDLAQHVVEQAVATAHERGATPELSRALYLRAVVACSRGELVPAEADMRQTVDLARFTGFTPATLLSVMPTLVEILIERDELDTAEAELEALGVGSSPLPSNILFGLLRLKRGHLRAERGEFERSLEDLGDLGGQARSIGLGPVPVVAVSPYAVRALVAIGQQDQARELVYDVNAMARRWGDPIGIALALRAAASVQEGDEKVALLEEAEELGARSNAQVRRLHVLVELGEALRRCGRRLDAREPLREAFQLARQCGAVRLAKRSHDELQATGITLRRYAPIGVESLTPSERRVVELAASGMTNRQIAQSLFVTIKTVEAHLSAAYDKLDIKSRGQLSGVLEASEESMA